MLKTVDAVHGFFYALMHVWFKLVTYNPLTLRLPSVLAVAATAGILVFIGKRLWGLRSGVVAGVVFAALPRTLWMAGDGRSAALTTLMITVAAYCLLRVNEHTMWWAAFAASMSIAIWLFVFAALMLPVFFVAGWMRSRGGGERRRLSAACTVAGLSALALAAVAMTQHGQVKWLPPTTIEIASRSLGDVFLVSSAGFRDLGLLLIGSLLAGFIAIAVQNRMDAGTNSNQFVVVLILGWLIFPTTVLVVSNIWLPAFVPRYSSFSAPAVALLAAATVFGLGNRLRYVVAVGPVSVLVGASYLPTFRAEDAKSRMLEVVSAVELSKEDVDYVWFCGDRGGSARMVKYAYPHAFEGVTDLSLAKSFEKSGTLWGIGRQPHELPVRAKDKDLIRLFTIEGGWLTACADW